MKTTIIPPLLVLTLTIMLALAFAEDYTAGLGVSDYEAHPQVIIGHTQMFEVARVSNQGTLNLTVTSVYVPDYNATAAGIKMVFTPNTTMLVPQENVIIYGEVTEATMLGTYSGRVEFKTVVALPEGYTGNPSTPGGSSKITVSIVETPPPKVAYSWFDGVNIYILGVASSIGMALSSFGIVFYRKRKSLKPAIFKPKLPTPTKLPRISVSAVASNPAPTISPVSKEDEDITDQLARMFKDPEAKV